MDRSHWIYFFMIVSAITASIATILTRMESKESSKRNRDQLSQIEKLQIEVQKKTLGGEEMPAILVLPGRNQVALLVFTIGPDPLVDVRVKCNEIVLPDIGTVYPEVTRRFFDDPLPSSTDSVVYNLVVWYNRTKSLQARVILLRGEDGFWRAETEYHNSDGKVFEHPYQGKNNKRTNDSSPPDHYRPEQHG